MFPGYWVDKVNNRVMFAAVDCTGHGVPGAFMSLMGHNGLNQSIKNMASPGHRGAARPEPHLVRGAYRGPRPVRARRHGRGPLRAFDPERMVLDYAGANCPLYLLRDGEVISYSPDKRPIGGFDLGDLASPTTASSCAGDVITSSAMDTPSVRWTQWQRSSSTVASA